MQNAHVGLQRPFLGKQFVAHPAFKFFRHAAYVTQVSIQIKLIFIRATTIIRAEEMTI